MQCYVQGRLIKHFNWFLFEFSKIGTTQRSQSFQVHGH